jgi:hypothetical protein
VPLGWQGGSGNHTRLHTPLGGQAPLQALWAVPDDVHLRTLPYRSAQEKPVVNPVFPLRDTGEAHRRMDTGERFDKPVLIL